MSYSKIKKPVCQSNKISIYFARNKNRDTNNVEQNQNSSKFAKFLCEFFSSLIPSSKGGVYMPHHLRFCSHRFLSVLLWWKIIKRLQWVASNNTWVKRFQIPWNILWKSLMGCLFLADSGSKVNGLKQPFHLRRVYYQLLQVLSDVWGDNQEIWNGGELQMVSS